MFRSVPPRRSTSALGLLPFPSFQIRMPRYGPVLIGRRSIVDCVLKLIGCWHGPLGHVGLSVLKIITGAGPEPPTTEVISPVPEMLIPPPAMMYIPGFRVIVTLFL